MSKLQKKPSALKRGHPTLQNMNFYKFFSTFVGNFWPPWSAGQGSGRGRKQRKSKQGTGKAQSERGRKYMKKIKKKVRGKREGKKVRGRMEMVKRGGGVRENEKVTIICVKQRDCNTYIG
jgi:hypothetical protein